MAYFRRLDETRFTPTEHTGGAWREDEQHIAPALGLVTHVIERDFAERRGGDPLVAARLSFDILGTVPVDTVDTSVSVLRPGRTIELVEATMAHGGRDIVRARAWLTRASDTATLEGTEFPAMPRPEDLGSWNGSQVWNGGFIASTDIRRENSGPGRSRCWVRVPYPLVDDDEVSPLARFCGVIDIANGIAVRADPREVAFPNLDLTAHFFRAPEDEWVGVDTTVSFGPGGVGLTHSVLHDVRGPVGTSSQILTVRPNPA